jgi:peptidoglycan/xylan/chitin deacetylase (PgdA/CDA1 family)
MRLFAVVLFALLSFLAFAGSAQAAPNTTVSFTFDDGRPSQLAAATELASHGMSASFFIITGQIGLPGVMTVADLNTLKSQGMEIGAHTVLHRDLPTLSSDEAMRELCLSRNWLMDRGFDVYDMAYPHDTTNASVEQLVANCGYNSARTGSQLQCDANHACAETVPPLDPYSLRTPNDFNNSTTLAQMKAAVTNAENNGGGWVPLEMHDVCDLGETLPDGETCFAPYYVTHALFTQFLTWLQGEVDAGRVQVKTVHDVIGGALKPEVPVSPAPVRTGNMLVNPSFEQAGTNGQPSSCWANINNGPNHPPTITTTTDAHDGSKALAISMPATYDSWAYNLIAPALDLAQCSPTAIPGHHYTFTGWYKGNGPIKVVAYWRNADNQWARLDWGSLGTASFPASTPWAKATFTFLAPAGATAVSAGFYVDTASTNHTYTIDDTSLIDADAPTGFALSVTAAGTGSGTVTSSPAGINCGATCQASYSTGATVTLTAAAAAGSSFTGWSGACTGSSSTCAVSMSAAMSATATFTLLPVQLSVSEAGTGDGTITSSPAGINCGATCQASFTNGATVTLTAAAAAGSSFTAWSGACTGSSSTCAVSMSAAKSVTATFTLLPVQLSVFVAGTGDGTITSSPAGINCGATCQFSFVNGATVTLTAVAAAGSSLTGWSGACTGSPSTCTVSLDVARSATATFTLLPMLLTVGKSGTGGGTVTSSPAGIDCGATCQFSFVNGASVTLTAVAAAGSSFTGWSGACTGTSTTCTVSLSVAKSVTATFTLLPMPLTVSKSGTGSGTVTSSPAGINCGATCQFSFVNGATVTLTAVAAAGSSFTGWSGACTGTSTTCAVSLDVARSVTATFTLLPVQLTVSEAGTGGGTVTSSPAGIDCGATCQFSFVNGASVTLTAVAAAGSSFTGWSGACTGSATTCTVTLNLARSVTATFTLLPMPLTVSKSGTGSGTVTSSPAGINCGATCQFSFVNGATVTLTAVAAPGSSFTGWTGACTGSATTCTITQDVARFVTATFTLLPVQLNVSTGGTGDGTVTSSPAGIDCGATCQFSFVNGATVTLTAVAAPGSSFTGWTGACSGSSTTCTVSLDVVRSVTATFTLLPVQLTVSTAGTGAGSVTSNPAGGIDCGTTCLASLENGTTVTLIATAADGSTFTGWSDPSCGGTATCTVFLDVARSVTAIFTANPVVPPASLDLAVATPLAVVAVVPAAVVVKTAVKSRPAFRARPKVSGRPGVGRTLTCSRGSWNGSPTRFAFTWLRDGKVVIGHGARYVIRTADRGHSIRCSVTAGNAKGATTVASGTVHIPR